MTQTLLLTRKAWYIRVWIVIEVGSLQQSMRDYQDFNKSQIAYEVEIWSMIQSDTDMHYHAQKLYTRPRNRWNKRFYPCLRGIKYDDSIFEWIRNRSKWEFMISS